MSSQIRGSSTRLRDLAVFIRSKNAGPFVLTIDIFFDSAEDCERVIRAEVLSASNVAAIYKIDAATIQIIHVAQSNALKISIPRPLAAGDVGDRDVAGGQQFAPLLNIAVPLGAPRD
jgi:Domain of unknown function (DUF4387)